MTSEAQGDVSRRGSLSARNASSRRSLRVPLLLCLLVIAALGSSPALAQAPMSIFGHAVPANPVEGDDNAVTLGVKFWSSRAGTISAIRFYRGATSPIGYIARLYSAAGKILGSVTLSTEFGPGPRVADGVLFGTHFNISKYNLYSSLLYT